jgi:Phage tail assembly chaperone, TAC
VSDLREAMRQAAAARDLVAVDVPEWEEKVYIRKISVRDQMQLSDETQDPKRLAMRILLVSISDENGNRKLTDDDLELLLDQPFPVIMPLLLEAARVNGQSESEVREAVESFGNARSGDSSSA